MAERSCTKASANFLMTAETRMGHLWMPGLPARTPMRATDLPTPEPTRFPEAEVRFAVAAWPMRAAEELRSALVFRALERAAREAGAPAPWPACFHAAVHDEMRHARLCAIVGARLGAAAPRYDSAAVRARLSTLPSAELRVAALLLVEVAIGETISTCLFSAGRRAATEPLTRTALGLILRDEVRHQRLGWRALDALWPSLSSLAREAMQREARAGLAACEQSNAVPAIRWLKEERPFAPSYAALGVLHPEARIEAFYFAVERLVLPRLTRLGLDGQSAWQSRYRAS